MTELLDDAAEALERMLFFDQLDARYIELRGDRDAWEAIEQERASEEPSLSDGFE